MHRLLLLALALVGASAASAQSVEGVLSAASDTLTSGEYKYVLEVEALAGQTLVARLGSETFDTYLIIKSPTGEQEDNDDCSPGDLTRSCVQFVADADGTYRIIATSFRPGETGPFVLGVRVDDTPVVRDESSGS